LGLARKQVRIILASRTKDELIDVRDEIIKSGGQAKFLVTDLAQEEECISLIRFAIESYHRLDILVNNAGMGVFGPLEKVTTSQWDTVMAVNARGPFLLCREAIPFLKKQSRSFIINITSVVGKKGYIHQSLYSASKHAVMGMSKALAKEVQDLGIRVHAICPGGVDTEMVSRARPDLDRSILMEPEEIADIVDFLVTRTGNAAIDEISVRRQTSTPWA